MANLLSMVSTTKLSRIKFQRFAAGGASQVIPSVSNGKSCDLCFAGKCRTLQQNKYKFGKH